MVDSYKMTAKQTDDTGIHSVQRDRQTYVFSSVTFPVGDLVVVSLPQTTMKVEGHGIDDDESLNNKSA